MEILHCSTHASDSTMNHSASFEEEGAATEVHLSLPLPLPPNSGMASSISLVPLPIRVRPLPVTGDPELARFSPRKPRSESRSPTSGIHPSSIGSGAPAAPILPSSRRQLATFTWGDSSASNGMEQVVSPCPCDMPSVYVTLTSAPTVGMLHFDRPYPYPAYDDVDLEPELPLISGSFPVLQLRGT